MQSPCHGCRSEIEKYDIAGGFDAVAIDGKHAEQKQSEHYYDGGFAKRHVHEHRAGVFHRHDKDDDCACRRKEHQAAHAFAVEHEKQ